MRERVWARYHPREKKILLSQLAELRCQYRCSDNRVNVIQSLPLPASQTYCMSVHTRSHYALWASGQTTSVQTGQEKHETQTMVYARAVLVRKS
jgi:hypothetical protein